MKRTFAFILCFVIASALFVGCNSNSDKTSDKNASSKDHSEVISVTGDGDDDSFHPSILPPTVNNDYHDDFDPYVSMPDSIKGQTVRYATWVDHNKTIGKRALNNIYADIGINVELFMVSENSYVDKIMTSIASGDIPDAFKTTSGKNGFPLTLQLAAPINEVSDVDLNEPIWHKKLNKTATIDNHVYFVNTISSPWSNSNIVYYNKKLFEDNNIKTPVEYFEEGDWTWSRMLEVMQKIKNLGSNYVGGCIDVEVLGSSIGASFCKYDYKTATFSSGVNSQELLNTYQWYSNAKEQGLIVNDGFKSFTDGKCGIVITDTNGLLNTGYFKDMDWRDIGFTYLPSSEPDKDAYVSSNYHLYGIIDGAPHANAAGYFLRYWLDLNNFDVFDTFISNKAANFYLDVVYSNPDDMYFNFDGACGALVGGDGTCDIFNSELKNATADTVNAKLNAVADKVDEAVAKANQIIADLKKRNQ